MSFLVLVFVILCIFIANYALIILASIVHFLVSRFVDGGYRRVGRERLNKLK